MRVTILKDDNKVMVDGEGHTVDCSDLPANFHALQWTDNHGEIEYGMVRCEHCGGRSKKPNETIAGIGIYQVYVDRWHEAKAAAEAEKAKADVAGPQS